MKYISLYILLLLVLVGCVSKTPEFDEAQSILKEAEKLISDIEALDDYSQDYNFDGVADVYYENYNNSYVQFTDRNFDGKADEKYEYDSGTDFILDGRLDNNFDGIFETQEVIFQGIIQFEFVDSNNDRLIDIVSSFEHGVLKSVQKYILENRSSLNQIESYEFNFGVPQNTKIRDTNLSAREFHEEQTRKIKTQKMYHDKDET